MEIQKRTSHGRGEYEIAGSIGALSTSALLNKPLTLDAGGVFGELDTGVVLRTQGGKPRLRMVDSDGIHIQRWIEALLVMPKSIRGEGQLLGGQPVVIAERYVLRRAEITAAEVLTDRVRLRIGGIDCINDSGTHQIDLPSRLRQIETLYERAEEFPERLKTALLAHRDDIAANRKATKITERIVAEIISAAEEAARESDSVLIVGEDPVPLLLDLLHAKPSVEIPPLAEIDPQDVEIRRRVADRWRIQKDRGYASTQFRKEVRAAYKSTCLICGTRLPSSDKVRTPGVDAAHIVPWAHYDVDVVGNGLCLCKLHHWAFDQYLLALKFDSTTGYHLVVTDLAREAFANDPNTLAVFEALAGPIAVSRLPENPDHWPHPKLLAQLYEDVRIDL